MLGYNRWQLFKGFALAVAIVSLVSLILIYFIPAPPSKVVMATAFKGSSFEYYAQQYREIFADISQCNPMSRFTSESGYAFGPHRQRVSVMRKSIAVCSLTQRA